MSRVPYMICKMYAYEKELGCISNKEIKVELKY